MLLTFESPQATAPAQYGFKYSAFLPATVNGLCHILDSLTDPDRDAESDFSRTSWKYEQRAVDDSGCDLYASMRPSYGQQS